MSNSTPANHQALAPELLNRLQSNPVFTEADQSVILQVGNNELSIEAAAGIVHNNIQADAATSLATALQHEVLNDDDHKVLTCMAAGEITPEEGNRQLAALWAARQPKQE